MIKEKIINKKQFFKSKINKKKVQKNIFTNNFKNH